MKEILIDLYKAKNLFSGLGQFSVNFAKELVTHSVDDLNFIFLTPKKIEFENIKSVNVSFQKRYFPSLNKTYDVWHSLQQFPSHFPNKKSKFILTVHDLNFLIEKNETKKLKYLQRLQKNIDRADYITTISDYTKKTIEDNINLRGKSIKTIYNGIAVNSNCEVIKPNYVSNQKFFFSIGIFKEKKNFHTLLSLMKSFEDYHLIIAGDNDTPYGNQVQKQINDLTLADRIILPGKINDNDKFWLYKNCEAFLFPSLAEGFGMPVIEAMNFGKPVFLSKFTSLPEIGGDSAFYFENFDEEYMSAFIKSKLSYYHENQTNISEQIKKHAEKFRWENCITQYIKLYNKIIKGN